MNELRIEISGNMIAWYGAVTATVGIILSFLNYLRDRSRVKVKLSTAFLAFGSNLSEEFLCIEAVNFGRRAITLVGVGAFLGKKINAVITKPTGLVLPCELGEGKSVSAFTDKREFLNNIHENGGNKDAIKYFWFKDATGRIYKTRKNISKLLKI